MLASCYYLKHKPITTAEKLMSELTAPEEKEVYVTSIGEDLEVARSLSTLMNFYVEDHCEDQALLTVSLELTRKLDAIAEKYGR